MAEPVRVGELLAALPGLADCLGEARLLAAWPALAGPAASRTRAEGLENGVLRVTVDSSGWLDRLTLEAPALLARCRAAAPGLSLRAIRFHLASPTSGATGPEGGEREVGR